MLDNVKNKATLKLFINLSFRFQLYVETQRFEQLTQKMVLDFIEDFVNHRVWGLADEFKDYIVDIKDDKFAFFYSRGAIEPYILLDKRFTEDTYCTSNEEVVSLHWTDEAGLNNLQDSIDNKTQFSKNVLIVKVK